MPQEVSRYLDGDALADALVSGIHRVIGEQDFLNHINVFPVADGDTGPDEVEVAADLLAAHAPDAPVFLQPVTPIGGSPALSPADCDRLADVLLSRRLDVRVVPQVHKILGVR